MADSKRVFILGAGFSKPAGMPLATELLPRIIDKLPGDAEMREWLDDLRECMAWLSGEGEQADRTTRHPAGIVDSDLGVGGRNERIAHLPPR